MQCYLMRYDYRKTHTRGLLMMDGLTLHTLERPWLNNKANVSCVPSGEYQVNYLAKSGSGNFDRTYHLQSVPGRTGILIHKGNIADNSKGCILVGMKPGSLWGKPAVLSSSVAMQKLRNLIGKDSFTLHITGNQLNTEIDHV